MTSHTATTQRPGQIQAVLVLYRCTFAESHTFRTLKPLLHAQTELAARFDLLAVDNSAEPQPVPEGVEYLHDGTNPGLATRYNTALALALERGATWLLLLDQDTTLTAAWLQELEELSETLTKDARVCALVPRLVTALPGGDRTESPHPPSFLAIPALDQDTYGLMAGLVRVYNSAALVRVEALQGIGGFPVSYPLDYLDHATFHRLQAAGGRVYLMRAALVHAMSIYRVDRHRDPDHAVRHHGQLAAEVRFYREHGTPAERRAHRLHLLRKGLEALVHGQLAEGVRLLLAAVART